MSRQPSTLRFPHNRAGNSQGRVEQITGRFILKDGDLPVPVVDSLDVLAQAAIREARGRK
ncbi:MAG: hypothetical protein NTY86_20285 [Deltaproteobacteria bacterium]|nr:hypothetical protein [Deltaproteobacteria bacterium]